MGFDEISVRTCEHPKVYPLSHTISIRLVFDTA